MEIKLGDKFILPILEVTQVAERYGIDQVRCGDSNYTHEITWIPEDKK